MRKVAVNIFRIGFVVVLVFEIVRWKVLKSSITFSWVGLVLTAVLVLLCLEGVLLFLRRKFGVLLSPTSYGLALISLSLDAFGDMYGWYTKFSPWFDRVLHLFGGLVVAWILCEIIFSLNEKLHFSSSKKFIVLFVVSITFFIGFTYEWLEYAEDVFYWHRQVRLGDAYDTIDDMQLDLLGGILGSVVAARASRRQKVDI